MFSLDTSPNNPVGKEFLVTLVVAISLPQGQKGNALL